MEGLSGFELMNDPWIIIASLFAGALYAVVFYTRKAPWGKNFNGLLAVLRFLLVSIIVFLLLSPFIKFIKNVYEKPVVVFAIDNSQSLAYNTSSDSLKQFLGNIKKYAGDLNDHGMNTEMYTLDGKVPAGDLENTRFHKPATNLSGMLDNIVKTYENRNLTDIVLLSDGIYNQGTSPDYKQYNVNIHTVGMGDTTEKKDVAINNLYYNKIANIDNKFPIVAEIKNTGFKGKTTQVLLKKDGETLQRKPLKFTEKKGLNEVKFMSSAAKKGMVHYTVEVIPFGNEFSEKNNTADAYIDIIDSKNKVLLVAPAPHPDIKAIRKAVTNKKNQEFQVYIPGMHEYEKDKYDLVIFHQVPNKKGIGHDILTKFMEKNSAVFFVTGMQTDFNRLNNILSDVKVMQKGQQTDQVTALFNNDFSKYQFRRSWQEKLNQYPPVRVPFGDFDMSENVEIAISQTVGNINTEKPLLVYAINDKQKKGCFFGDGLWKWRMHEYSETRNTEAFDALISKTVQLLSKKEDKRRFRFDPESNEYYTNETVSFITEIYNEIYEKTYGNKVNLKLKNQETDKVYNYSFTYNQSNESFEVNGLPQGIYQYTASTSLDGELKKASGTITIKALQLEYLSATADHQLLRKLSENTAGKFYNADNTGKIKNRFINDKPKQIIRSQEEITEIINLRWIFFILLGLISLEWFFRKYLGGY